MNTTVRELKAQDINIFVNCPFEKLDKQTLWSMFVLLYLNKQTIFKIPDCNTSEEIIDYVTMLLNTYSYKYNGLLASIDFIYSPIDNYNMVEQFEQTDDFTNALNANNGRTIDTTNDSTVSNDGTNTLSTKAFDAVDFQGKDQTSVNTTESGKVTASNTETENKNETAKNTGTRTTSTTRKGNIGVTTTQQMIQQEREVLNYNLYEIVCADVADKILLKVY